MAEPQEQLNDGGDGGWWGRLNDFVETVADKGIEFVSATRPPAAPQPPPDQTPTRPVNQTPADPPPQTTGMQGQQGNQQMLLLGGGLLLAALLIPRLRGRG